jgi:hypothetical protein
VLYRFIKFALLYEIKWTKVMLMKIGEQNKGAREDTRVWVCFCSVGWWLVLICYERKVLLAGCWWLVCSERKVLLAGG